MPHHVIIGNGIAGVSAAEAIRNNSADATITIISAETEPLYFRPRVPDVIEGKVEPANIYVKPEQWYDDQDIEQRLGARVTAVHPDDNRITLVSGEEIEYDTLLIATGARPRKLPIPGIDLEGLVTLRDLDDARTIEGLLPGAKRAGVIGGGLLGVELARVFRSHGLEVEMINLLDWYWPEMLDETAAGIIEKKLEEKGITLCNNTNTTAIVSEPDEREVCGITTEAGDEKAFDIVGLAVGVVPNIDLLEGSGVETGRGVIVDEYLRTNYPNIYAAGDVAQAYDVVYEKHMVHTAWMIAKEQGEIAGQNMAGEGKKYLGGIPANTIRIYDTPVTSMGISAPMSMEEGDEVYTMAVPEKGVYKRYVLRDDIFVGATFITDIKEAKIAEALIKEGVDLSLIKDELSDPSFSFAPYLQTNLKIICPVCKAELKLKLGSKEGDRLICPICDAVLELHEENGILVPEEIITESEE